MIRTLMVVALLGTAAAASAQVATGNPPGNTVAPATGAVTTAPMTPAASASAGDMVPAGTPKKVAAQQYKSDLVCKTEVQTGSLIAKKKTCLTRKQWQYVQDENQREAYRYVQDNTTKSGGN